MLRQPLHSLILILLLFIATFGFALRSVEYLTVRGQIFSISDYYRSIGFLSADHEFNVDREFYDVSKGADLIENSRYIEFVDRRRGAEAFLQGVLNADVDGSHFLERESARELGLEDLRYLQDAYFYGELIDKIEHRGGGWRLILTVDDVLVGYPEHVVAGQEKLQIDFNLEEGDESAIANMEIGERYFLRGTFSPLAPSHLDDPFSTSMMPTIGSERNVLLMLPLNPNGLWYVRVPYGEMIDFTIPGLEHTLEEIEFLQRHHHAVQLRTTQDMALIPFMLEDSEMGVISDGRPIDQEDYLNVNPVAVIHYQFARIRDLSVGDTIIVKIPQTHHVENMIVELQGMSLDQVQTFYDVHIESVPQDVGAHEIELEIVGIYNLFQRSGGSIGTKLSTFIYIPDSILPDDVIITSDRWGNLDVQAYLSPTWYSFMLRSTRDEDAFIAEVRAPLEEMGFTLTMIESGAENFWESANIILQSITFNGIVFSVVLILVLLLVTFLFLRQRRKEFAVSRMLGYSASRSVRGVLETSILFFVPIAIGSILAWLFAQHMVVNSMERFEALSAGYEVSEAYYEAYEVAFSLSFYWLVGLIAIVFVLTMLMVLIGAIQMTRRPVLELLQRKR